MFDGLSLVTSSMLHLMLRRHAFRPSDRLHRALDGRRGPSPRELRDRGLHRALRDRLLRIVDRVEADDPDLARSCPRPRSPRPRRAPSCRCTAKTRVDVRVRLQHVLEDVEALVALPVRRLRRDDLDARRVLRWRRGIRAAASRRSRGPGMPSRTPTLRLAARGLDEILAGDLAALVVVGADEARRSSRRRRPAACAIEPRVDDDDGMLAALAFDERRHDLRRAARRDQRAP